MRASGPSTTDNCPAVILTGGKSRRMGKDKASLIIDGLTLLERAAFILREHFSPVYVSVRELPARVPEGCLSVVDIYPGCGPMAGLHSAFKNTDAEKLFLTAVDLPYLTGEAAAKITQLLEGYDACIIKREDGYIEPLFAAYSRRCLDIADYLLSTGVYKMSELIRQCNTRYVALRDITDCSQLLTNVNTPEDFEDAIKTL